MVSVLKANFQLVDVKGSARLQPTGDFFFIPWAHKKKFVMTFG